MKYLKRFENSNIKDVTIFKVDDYVYDEYLCTYGVISKLMYDKYGKLEGYEYLTSYGSNFYDWIGRQKIRLMTPEEIEQWNIEKDVDKYNL
jgi:hypothetical protein